MYRRLLLALFAAVVLLASVGGCFSQPAVMRGARALLEQQPQEQDKIWIWLHLDDATKTGIYRCEHRQGGEVVCTKAQLVNSQ